MIIYKNVNPLYTKIYCAKFGWNWTSGSGEDFSQISSLYFYYFIIIFPWKKGVAFHFNKFEFSLPKNALCQVWLKLAKQWFWRRFLKFIFTTSLLSPLERGMELSNEQIWISFSQLCFVQRSVEIGPVVLEKFFKFC